MADPTAYSDKTQHNGVARREVEDDVLWLDPIGMEMCKDLRWAMVQAAAGAWLDYPAKNIGVVNETVYCIDYDPVTVREETASKAGVHPNRVAVYYVDDGIDR